MAKNSRKSAELASLSTEDLARLKAAYERRQKRAKYNKIRNARPEVQEARREYNRKRWADEKAAKKLAATLTPAQLAAFLK